MCRCSVADLRCHTATHSVAFVSVRSPHLSPHATPSFPYLPPPHIHISCSAPCHHQHQKWYAYFYTYVSMNTRSRVDRHEVAHVGGEQARRVLLTHLAEAG